MSYIFCKNMAVKSHYEIYIRKKSIIQLIKIILNQMYKMPESIKIFEYKERTYNKKESLWKTYQGNISQYREVTFYICI